MTTERTRGRTAALVIGAWLYVGIPLAWGVIEVARKALDLFR